MSYSIANRIPLCRPWLEHEEASAAQKAILSQWVTQGPRVEVFEKVFAQYVGSSHACAVSNCTAGLHLALMVAGVQPGDVVLTVSHSFIATANAVRHCYAEPVFVDIDTATFNMCPKELERCLAEDFEWRGAGLWFKKTTSLISRDSPWRHFRDNLGRLGAVLLVHQAGMPADLERILPLTKKYRVPLVEDAACAVGSEVKLSNGCWQRVGVPHGDFACFSFHPRKVITTGDGGMITTRNSEYDLTFRRLRHQGMSVSDRIRHESDTTIVEQYPVVGYNYRLTDIQASVGIEQINRLPEIVSKRRRLARSYREALGAAEGIRLPLEPSYARTNWQSYIVLLDDPKWQIPFMQKLLKDGVSTKPAIMCAHREEPYTFAWPKGCLPRSELCRDQGVILPLFPTMTESEFDRVVSSVLGALRMCQDKETKRRKS